MIGKSVPRVDAYEKVTGRAKFTDDLILNKCLVARVYHAKIGNGVVKFIDTSEAEALDGVVKVVTFKDVPNHCYPTPGHPWSVELAHQDVADRNLLTGRVRYYGDDIAAVVAEDEVTASRALKLIKVEYEEYPVVVSPKISMRGTEHPIHLDKKDNILARSSFAIGDVDSAMEKAAVKLKRSYKTPIVQHCHIENNISYAYMEKGRVVVVSSTQIPHIVRRIVGQALGIPWGQVRVIKPYVGGGFGNKQEVLYEPLNAFLTMQVGGRPVKIELTREETFTNTRTRHSIEYDMEAGVDAEGHLLAKEMIKREKEGKGFTFFHFMIDLTGGPCVAKRLSGCGSGTEYLAVTPWGDLYPCHQFVGEEDFLMGNVYEGVKKDEIVKEFKACNVYSKEECKKCFARFYCSGGCSANSYNFNGTIDGTYEIGCKLERKRVECALMVKAALALEGETENEEA